jgi:hypothetical protein
MKMISEKLEYWAAILDGCSKRKDNPTAVLQAVADDLREWIDIVKTLTDLSESAEGGDQIIIYTKEFSPDSTH